MSSDSEHLEPNTNPLIPTAKAMAVPWILVLLLAIGLYIAKPDYLSALWNDDMGLKMVTRSLGAGGSVACICFVGYWLIFRSAKRYGWSAKSRLALIGVSIIWCLFGIAPTIFVLVIGPAAIQIQRNLLK